MKNQDALWYFSHLDHRGCSLALHGARWIRKWPLQIPRRRRWIIPPVHFRTGFAVGAPNHFIDRYPLTGKEKMRLRRSTNRSKLPLGLELGVRGRSQRTYTNTFYLELSIGFRATRVIQKSGHFVIREINGSIRGGIGRKGVTISQPNKR